MTTPSTPTMTPPSPPPTGPPRRRRWPWVLLAVGGFVALAATLTSVAWFGRDVESRGMSIEPVSAIQFRGDAATFELVEAARDDVRVDIELTSSMWRDPSVATEVVDGVLVVTTDCPDAMTFFCSTETVVTVPQGSLSELHVDVDAGAVRLEGTAADVVATTQAGRIELVDHRGTAATLRTQAGRVEVDAAVAPQHLAVHVTTGDIDIDVPAGTYEVDAATNVGTVSTSVREADDAPHRITARTTVGDVDVVMR